MKRTKDGGLDEVKRHHARRCKLALSNVALEKGDGRSREGKAA